MKLYQKMGLTIEEFKSLLEQKLAEDKSMSVIALEFGVSSTAIFSWMKKFNISRRKELRSKVWLESQYISANQSAEEIAIELGVSGPAVLWYLDKFKIPKRNRSESQKLASRKRISPLHDHGSHRSRGYCFRYHNIYCRSISELMWLLDHNSDLDRLKWEPFIYKNHRPDVLLDGVVYEIKSCRSAMSDQEYARYQTLANGIKADLGYDYKLVFMRDLYPKKYHELLHEAKARGAKKGQDGPAITWS